MSILAIDAGTTGITCLIVSASGQTIARGYQEFEQHFPAPGFVEHEPEQIWQAVLESTKQALSQLATSNNAADAPTCIGITNQRETLALWDKQTLKAPTNAIVWQDRRTSEILNEPAFAEAAEMVKQKTGLDLDPYFTASKLLWVKRNLPEVWRSVEAGVMAVGTIDSYLVARMTGSRSHISDSTNASRTQLYNLETGEWDAELLELFGVPLQSLPNVVSSYGQLARSFGPAFLGLELDITAIAGDQQAALVGQGATRAGEAKCTYGTGAFLLLNIGNNAELRRPGVLTTVALQHPDGSREYAIEGSVFVAGAAVQWLRDGLKLIESASEVEALAGKVNHSDGVKFVPALTGLGAPFWKPDATGTITGITRGSTSAHIARATLDGIAFQVRAVFEAMGPADASLELKKLRVDGGASANNLLMQIQANELQCVIERPENLETTALGIAYLAGLGAGVWDSIETIRGLNRVRTTFQPDARRQGEYEAWLRVIESFA